MPICKLRSIGDIEVLKNKIRLFDRPAYFRIELLFSNTLSPERRRTLERRLAFALSDCGCALASFSLILIPLSFFLIGHYSFLPVWPNATLYVVCTFIGAGFAKLASLFMSYHLAHQTIDELLELYSTEQETVDDHLYEDNKKPIRS